MAQAHSNLPRLTPSLHRFAIAAACLAATPAFAANADLDPSYGFGGGFIRELGPVADYASSGALQPDGKLVMVGWSKDANQANRAAVMRHLVDGSPDTGYGDGTGKALFDLFGGYEDAVDLAHTQAGTYLAGTSYTYGTQNGAMSLIRLTPSGMLDTSFGLSGKFEARYDVYSTTRAMAVQRDGKILLAGHSWSASNEFNTLVIRVNPDGSLDTSFGLMGALRLNMSYAKTDRATDIVVRDDGRIIVAGYLQDGSTHKNFLLGLNEHGDYDIGFNNGQPYYHTRSGFHYYDPVVSVDADGKIVLASQSLRMTPYTWGVNLSRVLPNGMLETSYGTSGYTYTNFNGIGSYAPSSVELLPTGQAMLALSMWTGTQTSGSSTTYTARFTPAGALDTTYANVGYKQGEISSNTSTGTFSRFLALAPDGRFYVGGTTEWLFFALRYLGDPLDLTPDQGVIADSTNVARATQQTSNPFTVSGMTPGARVPITVSGGAYSLNGQPATSRPGYVSNGDVVRLVHTSSPNHGTAVTTQATLGGLSASNNRGTVLGAVMTASFSSLTAPETPPPGTGPGDGEAS